MDGRWRFTVPHDGVSDVRMVVQPDGRPVAFVTRVASRRQDRQRGIDAREVPVVADTEAPLGESAIRLSWGPRRKR